MRPTYFIFTLKSGKVIKICEGCIFTKSEAIKHLYSMFAYKPTIVDYKSN